MQVLVDFEGRHIRLTDERLAHIREHPEMEEREGDIMETLAGPRSVRQSVSDPDIRLYYRFYEQTTVGGK